MFLFKDKLFSYRQPDFYTGVFLYAMICQHKSVNKRKKNGSIWTKVKRKGK